MCLIQMPPSIESHARTGFHEQLNCRPNVLLSTYAINSKSTQPEVPDDLYIRREVRHICLSPNTYARVYPIPCYMMTIISR